jgi:hypothetical protein
MAQLLASLPTLRTLQLELPWGYEAVELQAFKVAVQGATQLQELYLKGPNPVFQDCHTVAAATSDTGSGNPSPKGSTTTKVALAELLPSSLRRLSWDMHYESGPMPHVAHLTHLTSLWLRRHKVENLSSRLPPGLQQLQLEFQATGTAQEVLEAHSGVVTGFVDSRYETSGGWQQLAAFPRLQAAHVKAEELDSPPANGAALAQLAELSSLTAFVRDFSGYRLLLHTAASLRGLRCLTIDIDMLPLPTDKGLGALTGLTRLTLIHFDYDPEKKEERRYQPWGRCKAWAREISRLSNLKYLSIPGQLVAVREPWLARLKQLRVLMLTGLAWPTGGPERDVLGEVVSWLERWYMAVLPAGLRLLGFDTQGTVADAVAMGLPGRLQRLLGSSGCEVVAGHCVEQLMDPTQQLAGLPEALQQALA